MNLKVWQLDPVNMTPYYNMALSAGLAGLGCEVWCMSSRQLHDLEMERSPLLNWQDIYFQGLDRAWLIQYPRLRKVLRGLMYPWGHWRLWQELQRNPPDIVHIQWSRMPIFDNWLVNAIKSQKIPVVHTVHDIVPLYARQAYDPAIERLYAKMNGLILHSQANQQDCLKTYTSLSPAQTFVIPLVVPPHQDHVHAGARQTARQHLNLPAEAFIFAFLGGIRPYKGLDIFLKALEQVFAKAPQAFALIGGFAQNPSDRPNFKPLEAYRDRILHYDGFIPSTEIKHYHLAADVEVFPYRHIYQSAALTSAMSYGNPVIATEIGSFPETVQGNGWLIPPENPDQLAQTMLEALEADLAPMRQRSLEIIHTKHTPAQVGQQLLAVYQQVLA